MLKLKTSANFSLHYYNLLSNYNESQNYVLNEKKNAAYMGTVTAIVSSYTKSSFQV